jgi:hypothetical protein
MHPLQKRQPTLQNTDEFEFNTEYVFIIHKKGLFSLYRYFTRCFGLIKTYDWYNTDKDQLDLLIFDFRQFTLKRVL